MKRHMWREVRRNSRTNAWPENARVRQCERCGRQYRQDRDGVRWIRRNDRGMWFEFRSHDQMPKCEGER